MKTTNGGPGRFNVVKGGGENTGKGEKMDKEAAARIQSAADRSGKNQDFKERAQSAAAMNEAKSRKT